MIKIDHILFPVDFSERAKVMNSQVEWLATHFNSRVTLLHVFQIPASWYGCAEAPLMSADAFKACMEGQRQRLNEYQIALPESQIERVFVEGDPAWEITRVANETNVDLIVMGKHGYGPLHRLLLGSVAMKVLHDSDCPVRTQSPAQAELQKGRGPRIEQIVCAIDLSSEAVPLLRFVDRLAADFRASVEIVHCVPSTDSPATTRFDAGFRYMQEAWARDEISRLQLEAETNFPVQITERYIAKDLAEAAAGLKAGLIVIGRGKTQDPLGTLRSHACEIIRRVSCPVLSFSMDQAEIPQQPSNQVNTKRACGGSGQCSNCKSKGAAQIETAATAAR